MIPLWCSECFTSDAAVENVYKTARRAGERSSITMEKKWTPLSPKTSPEKSGVCNSSSSPTILKRSGDVFDPSNVTSGTKALGEGASGNRDTSCYRYRKVTQMLWRGKLIM